MLSGWRLDCAWVIDRLVTTCCVVTAGTDELVNGCLVASVMPLGLTDGLIAFGLSRRSLTGQLAESSGGVALHLLGFDDIETARWFGRPSTAGDSRLNGLDWHRGSLGAPILASCVGFVEARIVHSAYLRDHVVHVAEAVHAATRDPRRAPFTIVEARDSHLEASRVSAGGGPRG